MVVAFRALLTAALAAGAAAHLAHGFTKVNPAEMVAMKKEVEAEVAARKAGKVYVPPPPPWTKPSAVKDSSTGLLKRSRGKAANVPPPPPLEAAPPVVQSVSPRRARSLAVVMKATVPVAAVAGVFAWRAWRELQLVGSLKDAWRDLQTAAGAAVAKAAPALPAGVTARRELLASLRRRSGLVGKLLPVYAALELKPPADLWTRDEAALVSLCDSLDARVAACGRMLDLHERLGQSPPSGFRAWKLPEIESYSANLEAKLPALQRVVGLYAQLGQSRVDLMMAEWSAEKLEAHAVSLAAQVEATRARREREALIGKVEAALWKREPDAQPPMGLATMSTSELRAVLAKLNGGKGAGNAT